MSAVLSEVFVRPLTVDEFLAWATKNAGRHELVGGQIYAMAPERLGHADAKYAVLTALKAAIRTAGLPCYGVPDGVTVRIDRDTAYEPDAQVYCGDKLSAHVTEIAEPIIVVEVLSPSTGFYDRHNKLADYFTVPSIHHYLIVDIDRAMVVHHARDGSRISTRMLSSGLLRLDPPGLDLTVEALLDIE